jgi:uncharacterized protein (TIGR02246 family)
MRFVDVCAIFLPTHRRTQVEVMGKLAVHAGAFCLLGVASSVFARNASDDAQIRVVVSSFSDIWARADIRGFESLLTEDVEWVVRSGTFLKGRPDVVAHHATLMERNFKGSRVSWQPLAVRFVRPDVAIVHVAAELTLQDGTKRPNGMVTLVFAKEAEQWRITAVQNTDRATQ